MRLAYAVPSEWWRPEIAEARPVPAGRASVDAATSPLAYAALLAFTLILLLAPQHRFPVLATLRIALLSGVLAIVAHVWNRWALGLPLARPARETRLVFLLLVWTLVGLPFSYWPGGSVELLLDLYLKALVVFWLIGNVVDTLPRLRGMAWTLTLLSIPLAAGGISNYLSDVTVSTHDRILGYDSGLTRNPNDLALMLNLILPLSVSLLLSSQRLRERALLLFTLALQLIAVVLTFSRAGFLTLALLLLVYAFRLRRTRSWRFVAAGALLVALAVAFLPAGYLERILTLRAIEADATGSAKERYSGNVAALDHVAEHPILGAGLGMNILVLNETVGAKWRAVHNTYLEYAVDLGVPGLLLFLLLLWTCFSSARAARRNGGAALFPLAQGIEISLIGFALAAIFHPAAYRFYFYYVGGLALAARTVAERDAEVPV
jgi:O-antigen ligase